MIEIIPAILPKTLNELDAGVHSVRAVAKLVQVDVIDGHFAQNKTWPYTDKASFEQIVGEERGLPLWEDVDYEFDLMLNNPAPDVMRYVHAGASRIIVHAASAGSIEALQTLAELRQGGEGAFSIQTGVALGLNAELDALDSFDALFDYIQVMGIARVGYQGEPFDTRALTMVERLRTRYPDTAIQVDGGVRADNARALVRAGASRLVVGSAIFAADNPEEAYKALYTEVNGAQ